MRFAPLLLLAACWVGPSQIDAKRIDTDTGREPDTDTDADTDSDSDADTDSDTDADTDADTDTDSDVSPDCDWSAPEWPGTPDEPGGYGYQYRLDACITPEAGLEGAFTLDLLVAGTPELSYCAAVVPLSSGAPATSCERCEFAFTDIEVGATYLSPDTHCEVFDISEESITIDWRGMGVADVDGTRMLAISDDGTTWDYFDPANYDYGAPLSTTHHDDGSLEMSWQLLLGYVE